jgi:hypothetical protein
MEGIYVWEPTTEDAHIGVGVIVQPVEYRFRRLTTHYQEWKRRTTGTVPFLLDERC